MSILGRLFNLGHSGVSADITLSAMAGRKACETFKEIGLTLSNGSLRINCEHGMASSITFASAAHGLRRLSLAHCKSQNITICTARKNLPHCRGMKICWHENELIVTEPPTSFASDPGNVTVCPHAADASFPGITILQDIEYWENRVRTGDGTAAAVVNLSPLVIAAFSDEIDHVVLLEFPEHFIEMHSLKLGKKLLTVNYYTMLGPLASDLVYGPDSRRFYFNFEPIIADFMVSDRQQLANRKKEIEPELWQNLAARTRVAMQQAKGRFRDGSPGKSGIPAY